MLVTVQITIRTSYVYNVAYFIHRLPLSRKAILNWKKSIRPFISQEWTPSGLGISTLRTALLLCADYLVALFFSFFFFCSLSCCMHAISMMPSSLHRGVCTVSDNHLFLGDSFFIPPHFEHTVALLLHKQP